MKKDTNLKKHLLLEMNYGTATHQLKKLILFDLLKQTNKNICFQCNKEIENINDLSIEHKKPWLNSETPKELFWDLNNIGFSHLKCNILAAIKIKGLKHPSIESYKRGCRCVECKEIQKVRMRNYRDKKSKI